jgi:hypothetical protein
MPPFYKGVIAAHATCSLKSYVGVSKKLVELDMDNSTWDHEDGDTACMKVKLDRGINGTMRY